VLSVRVDGSSVLVSLLTDFGLVDPFVAELKAVILSICHEARIVDVTHEVAEFDVRMGAFLLAEAAPSFPPGTVHVAVVDPGVGSNRRAIVVRTKRSTYVGPDNGLLISAAQREGIMGVFEISNKSMMRRKVSSTFHGRDVFAPTAAHIACGRRPEDCGARVSDYTPSLIHDPVMRDRSATFEVIHVDRFGNLATNLTDMHFKHLHLKFGQEVGLSIEGRRIRARVVRTFHDLRRNQVGIMLGSHGFMEIACRESDAAKRLRIRRGSVLHVSGY
jgi:S-adenosylmethionine hydrolase